MQYAMHFIKCTFDYLWWWIVSRISNRSEREKLKRERERQGWIGMLSRHIYTYIVVWSRA